MTIPPRPGPAPSAPAPAPPGQIGSRELAADLDRLDALDPADLDGIRAAAETVHDRLRERLGQAGAR